MDWFTEREVHCNNTVDNSKCDVTCQNQALIAEMRF